MRNPSQVACTATGFIAANGTRLSFSYDDLSRRIGKKVASQAPGSTWAELDFFGYAYDGWNMVMTVRFTAGTAARVASYVWGPDIGSTGYAGADWQKAGGVGGLLMVLDGVSNGSVSTPDPLDDDYFPLFDRLGNIIGYRKAAVSTATVDYNNLGATGALYDYDAFGRELRSSGPAADLVPFHFSSKFTDQETGLNYYGYRYYDPQNGRWLGRDPIGENGGANLNLVLENNTMNKADVLGLAATCCTCAMASLQAAAVRSWARDWNLTSPRWSFRTNECGQQAVAMASYLDVKLRRFSILCIKMTQVGGATGPYPLNFSIQHHVLQVEPDSGGQPCGAVPFLLDGFKGAATWFQDPNYFSCVREKTPREFQKEWPFEDPSAPSTIIYHPLPVTPVR